MSGRVSWSIGLLVVLGVVLGSVLMLVPGRGQRPRAIPARPAQSQDQELRARTYAALQPVRLANCTLARLGEPRDGGYLMCGNLLDAEAGYSYGISNYDGWGCQVSTQLGIPVHQYDCFDQRRPRCDGGQTRFHPECIAAAARVDEAGRRFDALDAQIAANGDAGRRLLVKMDVEGSEWESLLQTPREVLERIDQLAIELHMHEGDAWTQYLVVEKLRDVFHVAHLHFNNYACSPAVPPYPSYAPEVLLVNKRLAVLSTDRSPVPRPHPLDAPNNPDVPDCQYGPTEPRPRLR